MFQIANYTERAECIISIHIYINGMISEETLKQHCKKINVGKPTENKVIENVGTEILQFWLFFRFQQIFLDTSFKLTPNFTCLLLLFNHVSIPVCFAG